MSSLSQDELGHAAALYDLLAELPTPIATSSPTTGNPMRTAMPGSSTTAAATGR